MTIKNSSLSLTGHLGDLRQGLIKIILSWILGFTVCWFFKENILEFIKQPITPYLTATNGQLIFTSPIEKFLSYIKVTFFISLFCSYPYWLFQIWKFISPGLYKKERKYTLLFVFLGTLLFFLGIAFIYFVVSPLTFRFLLSFGGGEAVPYISLKEYLSFFLRIACTFGFIFQTPLILSWLIKLKLVSIEKLKQLRPYAIVTIAFLSAFFTPPDILSMFFLMLPMYLFFELSLWLGKRL